MICLQKDDKVGHQCAFVHPLSFVSCDAVLTTLFCVVLCVFSLVWPFFICASNRANSLSGIGVVCFVFGLLFCWLYIYKWWDTMPVVDVRYAKMTLNTRNLLCNLRECNLLRCYFQFSCSPPQNLQWWKITELISHFRFAYIGCIMWNTVTAVLNDTHTLFTSSLSLSSISSHNASFAAFEGYKEWLFEQTLSTAHTFTEWEMRWKSFTPANGRNYFSSELFVYTN